MADKTGVTRLGFCLMPKFLPAWANKRADEDLRGLTAMSRSDITPYGTFHLDMGRQLDLGRRVAVPRTRAGGAATRVAELSAPLVRPWMDGERCPQRLRLRDQHGSEA